MEPKKMLFRTTRSRARTPFYLSIYLYYCASVEKAVQESRTSMPRRGVGWHLDGVHVDSPRWDGARGSAAQALSSLGGPAYGHDALLQPDVNHGVYVIYGVIC